MASLDWYNKPYHTFVSSSHTTHITHPHSYSLPMKTFGSIAAIALVFIYIIGSGAWVSTGDNWYRTLNAPSWQPPDFIFGIIWPYNFIVLAVSAIIVASRSTNASTLIFLTFMALSIAAALTWAFQFYRPHNLGIATIALAFCAALTLPLLLITARASIPAAISLIPYQLWLIAATTVSYSYMQRN